MKQEIYYMLNGLIDKMHDKISHVGGRWKNDSMKILHQKIENRKRNKRSDGVDCSNLLTYHSSRQSYQWRMLWLISLDAPRQNSVSSSGYFFFCFYYYSTGVFAHLFLIEFWRDWLEIWPKCSLGSQVGCYCLSKHLRRKRSVLDTTACPLHVGIVFS